MRKQIIAANWKMNMTYPSAEKLIDDILNANINLQENQLVVLAVPYPYLIMAKNKLEKKYNYFTAAQNCHHRKSGAFTGEVSAEMLHSINISYCIIGHSERREYHAESHAMLAEKVNICMDNSITPIFCCGEPPEIRDAGKQNEFVAAQLKDSLFHLSADQIKKLIIAYEPVWAIGTGKTASSQQAQEMHHYLRSVMAAEYGNTIAQQISILYGGSIKASNAKELFNCSDVDGGLVGGASLRADEFIAIIKALQT